MISNYLHSVLTEREYACFLYVQHFDIDFLFLQVETESDLGDPIWLYHTLPNTF